MNIQYDYPALKDAHAKLEAQIENFKAGAKSLAEAGQELVEGNNAPGVKSTMTAFEEKVASIVKVMDSALEQSGKALANARELHVAMGGEE